MKVKGTITQIEEVPGEYGPYKIIHYKNEAGNFKKPCYLKDVDVLLFDGNEVEFDLEQKGFYKGKDGQQHKNYRIAGIEQVSESVSTVESGGDSTTRPTVSTPSESSERQASIEWQNARTNAVNLVVGFKDKFFEWSWPEILSTVIDTQQSLYSGTIKVNLEQAKEILETNQSKTGTKK